MIHRVFSLVLVAVSPAIGLADSWSPWQDRVVVSPNGKYYVVMKRTGGPKVYGEWGPVEYVIAERGSDTPPVKATESKIEAAGENDFDIDKGGQLYEITPNPGVAIRKDDKHLGRGNLDRPPLVVIVSDTGLGFVGLDVYGYNYAHYDAGLESDDAMIIVSATGKVAHRKRLIDLFTAEELNDFDTTAGGMEWLNYRNPGWLNHAMQQLVIVCAESESKPHQHRIRFVDWQSGQISNGPTQKSQNGVEAFKRETSTRKP